MTASPRASLRERAVRSTYVRLWRLRGAVAAGRMTASVVPRPLRDLFDIEGPVGGPLRIELGSGPYPTPGYIHVDSDRDALHLEHRAELWRLPFPDDAADEILAIHCLEHVHPRLVDRTVAEWRRVLRPGGVLKVHVPNGPALFRAFQEGDVGTKWTIVNALFGFYAPGRPTSAQDFAAAAAVPDHAAVYDRELLTHVLCTNGFTHVVDRTDEVVDRHADGWRGTVDDISLVLHAS